MSQSTSSASSERLITDLIDNGQVSRQQFIVVGLCLILNMLDGFDITAMAVVASSVAGELSLSPDKLGWIFSFALAGMMAGAMFLAPVSDLIGRRKTIIIAVFIIGVSIILTAYATTLTEFIILRLLSGAGAGAMLATQATLAAEYSPEKYRALSVAIVTAGYPLGATMTSVVAGVVMPDYGWRGMFIFGGTVTIAVGVIACVWIPESLKYLFERRPPDALQRVNRILAKFGKPSLAAMPSPATPNPEAKAGILEIMLKLLHPDHRRLSLLLWLSFFLCFASLYFLMSWIPKLMDDAGYSADVGRRAFFLFNLGGVLGIFLLGVLSTRWKLTNLICTLLVGAAMGMVLFASLPSQIGLMMMLIFIIGVLLQGGFTGMYSAAAKAYPTAIRSTGIGWAVGLGRLGAVVGPALAGYTIAAGLDMAANFYLFAAPVVIGGLIAYRLHIR